MTEPRVMRDAVNALRETSGHTHDPSATRRRIVGTVTRRKRQRRQLIAMLLVVFIGLPLGTTAYAAFFGTPAFVQAWVDHLTPRVVTNAGGPLATRRGEGHVAASAVDSSDVAQTPNANADSNSEAPVEVPLATRGEGNRSPRDIKRGEGSQAPTAAPKIVEQGEDEALYSRAHELHFVTRDPSAALDAWNAYLVHAPSTSLRPEAQYNRALCLVRLHRNAEAIEALTPFADGTYGNYRKREATALLRALAP